MYQNALIMMLFNTLTNTWHPIYYYEKPMPGPIQSDPDVIRYQSKGHHTTGFKEREAAVQSANELACKLKSQNDNVHIEIDVDLPWDGANIPADHQFRPGSYLKANNPATDQNDRQK